MGACLSAPADAAAPGTPRKGASVHETLAAETHFTVDQVYALQELFETVSSTHTTDGLIHKSEWALALLGVDPRPEAQLLAPSSAASSLFVDRVFAAFDAADNDVVDFNEFVRGLSVFHPAAPVDEKADFAFKIYDIHRTGAIEKRELRALLAAATADNPALALSDADLDALVDAAFAAGDAAGDGVIHPHEWRAIAARTPGALAFMTLPGLRGVTSKYPAWVFRKG